MAKITQLGAIFVAVIVCRPNLLPAQGTIVYNTSSLYYSAEQDLSFSVNMSGATAGDFTLISGNGGSVFSSVGTAWIGVAGDNKLITTDSSVYGGYFVASVSEGSSIGPSLSNDYVWYDRNCDSYHQAAICEESDAGVFTLISNGTHFVGFDVFYDGANHYGWMRLSNPSPFVGGYLLDWAYETTPNTPILAGAVPEPKAALLIACFAICGWLFTRGRGGSE